uniref:hypothetical protein n=1 Tax=uncultured Eudoraea sp. TaxID=1035614 RepID=UPI0026111B0C
MKITTALKFALAGLVAISLPATSWAESPQYKMTTQIPANVITPDKVETSIGTLEFNDGFPTEETAQ